MSCRSLLGRALAKGAPLVEIIPLHAVETAKVECLLDLAFDVQRRLRTAYRLREGTAVLPALSFAIMDGQVVVGSIQAWPVALWSAAGERIAPLVMVGPVAVHPDHQRGGIGRMLTAATLHAADAHADGALMMIGDPEYYGRFFGFSADATGGWALPGPCEPRRLLARAANGHEVPRNSGTIGPDHR